MLLRILSAIDTSALREKIHAVIDEQVASIEVLTDAKQSWEKISRNAFDIILMSEEIFRKQILKQKSKLQLSPQAPYIIIFVCQENSEKRAEYLTAGCEAILNANLSSKKLKSTLTTIIEKRRQLTVETMLVRRHLGEPTLEDFVSKSPAMKSFMKVVHRIVLSDSPILVLGETGVGKERLAHAIHAASPRSQGPFTAVNCAALPETLLESELFGHEEGAFTGATRSRRGCFELSHQGTLFLDEIAELPLHLQVKLLRAVERHEITRLGSERKIPIDVRIMAATNRNIIVEVEEKRFRRDLYYRLNVISLTIPPLRQRREDIAELVYNYIEYLGPRIGRTVTDITDEALECLCTYSWPGNVRELINIVERAMLLCEGDTIASEDLPVSCLGKIALPSEPISPDTDPETINTLTEDWLDKPLKEARQILVEQFEYRYITSLLRLTDGRIGKAAQRAGIDERSLFDKMKKYGLRKEDFK
jgi:DNA-binding NtrC family response regulator